jgi:Fe-S-cluster-containing hydrogenase component 2
MNNVDFIKVDSEKCPKCGLCVKICEINILYCQKMDSY